MKALLLIRNVIFLSTILLSLTQNPLLKAMDTIEDSIDFFNVGQGHAVLVNKAGATPLLIDAGSLNHPDKLGTRYDWVSQDKSSLASQISEKILKIWKDSNRGRISRKQLFLNVIITHPDKDHKDLLPLILKQLKTKTHRVSATFLPSFIIGGMSSQYADFLADYKDRIQYSEDFSGIYDSTDDLGCLKTSQCITHLFCPKGPKGNTPTDRNRWSIIVRLQIKGMSVLLAGDADNVVKAGMLNCLGDKKIELETDILLAPHHGAEGVYHIEWDQLVNPRTIIIGAALKHNHPKGKTLFEFLNLKEKKGRIWNDRVMAHGLQYYCEDSTHKKIVSSFKKRENRLFDYVPNDPVEAQAQQSEKQWHLAWIDLPIYTLWTTGSLHFEKELLVPEFMDAPHGLMNYIAVSDPKYLFDPYKRERLFAVSNKENEEVQKILALIQRKYKEKKMMNKKKMDQEYEIEKLGECYSNILMKELYLIDNPADRQLYLYALSKIFTEIEPLQYLSDLPVMCKTPCFRWLREAVISKSGDLHLREGINFLFRSSEKLIQEGDELPGYTDLSVGLCDENLEGLAYILKTFSKSHHTPHQLRNYIRSLSEIIEHGFSIRDLDMLCPSGFPEWLQLEKLAQLGHALVYPPIDNGLDDVADYPNSAELFDTLPLRLKGKTFKEIAKDRIEDKEFIRISRELLEEAPEEYEGVLMTPEEFQKALEKYFPAELDFFLT